jgi:DNA processing protein
MTEPLSPNTRAILLLTAPLIVGGGDRSRDLLTGMEYRKLARHLIELGAKPADLIARGADQLLRDCDRIIERARLERLLGRGFRLSQAIERWHARAIWVLSRADSPYPHKLKARLRDDSPAVLYGCGDTAILDSGGLAIVGSRNVDEEIIEYTRTIGRLAASAERTVVSGGARGVDQAAMIGALTGGGKAVGVLADSLEKAAMKREYRKGLMNRQLVLTSPYDPSARFNVGHAMQRNKVVYALAEAALVVNAEPNKGGTWAGAIEQLETHRHVPVFVRTAGAPSPGLNALVKRGAVRWPEPADADGMIAVLTAAGRERTPGPLQDDLPFQEQPTSAGSARESMPAYESITHPPPPEVPQRSAADELMVTVRSLLLRIATESVTASDIARNLAVTESQARKWLDMLVEEGTLAKTTRPVRYSVRPSTLFEGGTEQPGDNPASAE